MNQKMIFKKQIKQFVEQKQKESGINNGYYKKLEKIILKK